MCTQLLGQSDPQSPQHTVPFLDCTTLLTSASGVALRGRNPDLLLTPEPLKPTHQLAGFWGASWKGGRKEMPELRRSTLGAMSPVCVTEGLCVGCMHVYL
jgi:hypothetical protein